MSIPKHLRGKKNWYVLFPLLSDPNRFETIKNAQDQGLREFGSYGQALGLAREFYRTCHLYGWPSGSRAKVVKAQATI